MPGLNPGGGVSAADLTEVALGAHQRASGGMWAIPGAGGPGVVVMTAQQLAGVRFTPAKDLTIVSMKCEVSTLAAGADLEMAILDASGNRLGTTGTLVDAGATTGVKSGALGASVAVLAGVDYYAACLSDGGPSLRGWTMSTAGGASRFGSTMGLIDMFTDAAHGTTIQATSAADAASVVNPLLSLHT